MVNRFAARERDFTQAGTPGKHRQAMEGLIVNLVKR